MDFHESRVRLLHWLLGMMAVAGCSKGPALAPQNAKVLHATVTISDGAYYDFGPQPIEAMVDHSFTVTNGGDGPATGLSSTLFVSVFSFKGGAYPGTGGTCGSTLAAGASCTVVVTYHPLYQSEFTEGLSVNYTDGSTPESAQGPLMHGKAVYSSSGTLDTTYDSTGLVSTSLGGVSDHGRGIVLQSSDGRVVVAGSAAISGVSDFALARYNTDGSLDSKFGDEGTVKTSIGSGNSFANALALQTDGKIVAAGSSQVGGSSDFALARYNSDGSLDTAFGSGGMVTTAVGSGAAVVQAVAVQSDHKILVAGYTTNGSAHTFAIARYTTSGALDLGFGSNGILMPAMGTDDYARALAIQTDGRILVAGTITNSSTDFGLMRLNADGSFDSTFGSGGKVSTDIGFNTADQAWSMLLQTDGRIVLGGSSSNGGSKQFALVRYTVTGTLDNTFGSGGRELLSLGVGDAEIFAVLQQTDGKIVGVGYAMVGSEKNFAAARVGTGGALDTSFNTTGSGIYPFTSGASTAYGLVQQANAKLVAVGDVANAVGTTSEIALARIWP